MSQEDMRIPRPKVTPRPDGQPAANKTLDEWRKAADAHMDKHKEIKISGDTGVIFQDGNSKEPDSKKPIKVTTIHEGPWSRHKFEPGIDSRDPNQHLPF